MRVVPGRSEGGGPEVQEENARYSFRGDRFGSGGGRRLRRLRAAPPQNWIFHKNLFFYLNWIFDYKSNIHLKVQF